MTLFYALHSSLSTDQSVTVSPLFDGQPVEHLEDATVIFCRSHALYMLEDSHPQSMRVVWLDEASADALTTGAEWPDLADELLPPVPRDLDWIALAQRIRRAQADRRAQRQLQHRLNASHRRVSALEVASQALSELHDEADIFTRLVEVVSEHLESERVSILRVFAERRELRMVAAHGIPSEIIECARPKLGEGIAGQCALHAKPIFISNHKSYRDQVGGVVNDQAAMSGEGELPMSLTLPILVKGEVLGVVNVTGRVNDTPYSSSEIAFLSALMSHAGYLMESARLIERLRELQGFSEQVIHTLSDPLVVLDQNQNILKANTRFIEVFGAHDHLEVAFSGALSSTTKENLEENLAENFLEKLRAHLESSSGFTHPNLRCHDLVLDARLIPFDGQDSRALLILQDVTERQQMGKQLLSAEKMASLGILAAGVAHEINNPLGFVKTNTREAGRYVEDLFEVIDAWSAYGESIEVSPACPPLQAAREVGLDEIREDVPQLVRETLEGLERIQKITASLKSFAHPDTENTRDAQLITLVDNAMTITQSKWRHALTITRDLAEHPPISCIPSQLEQVFMNLIVNAAQAASSRQEIATMHISATLITSESTPKIEVRFADRCGGIPEAVVERIFDPFFTTKDIGEGTGLGLHIAHNIIEGHGGSIEVLSQPPEGTTFIITLPLGVKRGPLVIKQLSRFKA